MSRWLHFIGTTGFLLIFAACVAMNPLHMALAAAPAAAALFAGFRLEARRSSAPLLLLGIGCFALASPWVLLGVVWAYAFAWIGHFRIELNRPATFQYPLWSLAGDFRMVSWMWTGRLWSGNAHHIAPLAEP